MPICCWRDIFRGTGRGTEPKGIGAGRGSEISAPYAFDYEGSDSSVPLSSDRMFRRKLEFVSLIAPVAAWSVTEATGSSDLLVAPFIALAGAVLYDNARHKDTNSVKYTRDFARKCRVAQRRGRICSDNNAVKFPWMVKSDLQFSEGKNRASATGGIKRKDRCRGADKKPCNVYEFSTRGRIDGEVWKISYKTKEMNEEGLESRTYAINLGREFHISGWGVENRIESGFQRKKQVATVSDCRTESSRNRDRNRDRCNPPAEGEDEGTPKDINGIPFVGTFEGAFYTDFSHDESNWDADFTFEYEREDDGEEEIDVTMALVYQSNYYRLDFSPVALQDLSGEQNRRNLWMCISGTLGCAGAQCKASGCKIVKETRQ